MDFYKRIFVHVIPARITVPCFNLQTSGSLESENLQKSEGNINKKNLVIPANVTYSLVRNV